METITSATKRKKRKTRKCLDEIRKRSRRTTNDSLLKSPVTGKRRETVSILNDPRKSISNNNYITSNRLTLAMFPKAIRSETITRPVLSEIKNDATSYNRIVTNAQLPFDGGENAQPNEDSDFIKNSDEESISSAYVRCNEIGQMSLQKESDSEHSNRRDRSEGSFIMFSPRPHAMHHMADTDLCEESPNGQYLSTPISSSQSIREGFGYQLYEEFMNEIPIYLRENASALLKEDVMKKAKTTLHNIYMDSCRQECENNILQCIKTSVSPSSSCVPCTDRDTIIRNPMDYLRLGYAWRQSTTPALSASGTPPADSTVVSHAHPAPSFINDTPEYTYYPHKLNQ